MKKLLLIAAATALTIAFTACAPAQDVTTQSTPQSQQPIEEELVPTVPQPEAATSTDTDTDTTPDEEPTAETALSAMNSFNIYGETVTAEYFAQNELTLVNVWATWCPPCIAEMPTLADIHSQYSDQGLGMIGVVTDLVAQDGSLDESAVEAAHTIATSSEVEFHNLLVDEAIFNSLLPNVQAFPTTFFVDSKGNIVSEAYVGARSEQEWAEVVETELAALEG